MKNKILHYFIDDLLLRWAAQPRAQAQSMAAVQEPVFAIVQMFANFTMKNKHLYLKSETWCCYTTWKYMAKLTAKYKEVSRETHVIKSLMCSQFFFFPDMFLSILLLGEDLQLPFLVASTITLQTFLSFSRKISTFFKYTIEETLPWLQAFSKSQCHTGDKERNRISK